jgi:multicomponent Na+:H+ antiporter subunit B
MTGPFRNDIVRVLCDFLVPFVLMFGFYVVLHGHYTPGGGFTGGVVLGIGGILARLYLPESVAYRTFSTSVAYGVALAGMLLFMLLGLAPMLAGGAFLDYAYFPLIDLPAPELRYWGILLVEVAIGAAVAGTMLLLFDVLVGRES